MNDAEARNRVKSLAKAPLEFPGLEPLAVDLDGVKQLLPHRSPLLLVQGIDGVDPGVPGLVGHLDLDPADPVFAGHFPEHPVWPGVLQIEALGQAGIALARWLADDDAPLTDIALTHVMAARFVRPVRPADRVELRVRLHIDGLFFVVVGQALVDGRICCATAVKGLNPAD